MKKSFKTITEILSIKINNRKILTGIAEVIGEADKITVITVAIDKLDKIGPDGVNAELRDKGLSDDAIGKLQPIISLSGTNDEKLQTISDVLKDSEVGLKGVEETRFILDTLKTAGLNNEIQLDLTLARGLNYYTGAIFEVKALIRQWEASPVADDMTILRVYSVCRD